MIFFSIYSGFSPARRRRIGVPDELKAPDVVYSRLQKENAAGKTPEISRAGEVQRFPILVFSKREGMPAGTGDNGVSLALGEINQWKNFPWLWHGLNLSF